MSDLQLTEDRDVRDAPGPDDPGTAVLRRGPVRGGRARSALAAVSPAALWRRHKLFTFLVILSLLVRVLATRAFRPALLTADSFLYMKDAVQGTLGVIRPSGYSFFLQAVPAFHRLLAVTTLQHLMGVAIAAIVYGLLRYHGLPFWGATLAAVPTLFDTREIALESFILPDTVYCFVIVVAVALLLTKSRPRLWQCGVAGLLLGYAAVLRGNGLPVIVIAVVFMIIRRVGWRALAVGVLAAVIPVAGYVAAYHATYGQYNITSSDGIFLWSRTTSFANCTIIKPPADLAPLCPNLETSVVQAPARAWSVLALLNAPTAADYLWAPDVWWRTDSDPGINAHNDKLGQRFAIAAIKAQPLDYLRTVGRDIALVLTTTDRPQEQSTMTFTQHPHIGTLPPYYVKDLRQYAHTGQNTHAVQPYAYFLFLYQQPVVFGGLLFLFAVLAGLVGVLRSWRRWGGLQALPWVIAAVSIVLPAMLTQSLYRYTIVAIPLACLAAGMAFIRPSRQAVLAAAGSGTVAATGPGTGTGPAGTAAEAGAFGAGAVGASAAGAALAAGPGTTVQPVPGWETAGLVPGQADPAGAESPDPDVWASHDPDLWAQPTPDASAWPVAGGEDPVASAWTPPSGTAVRDASAWADPQTAGPEAAAPETAAPETASSQAAAAEAAAPDEAVPGMAAHEVVAPEVAAHEAAAHEAAAHEDAAHEGAAPSVVAAGLAADEPAPAELSTAGLSTAEGSTAGLGNAGPGNAEPVDAEPVDAEPVDAEPEAAEPVDAEPVDAEPEAPSAAGPETPSGSAPRPDTSAWAVPPTASRVAASPPDASPAGAEAVAPEPDPEAEPVIPPAGPMAPAGSVDTAAEPGFPPAAPGPAGPQAPDPAISAWLAPAPPAPAPPAAAPDTSAWARQAPAAPAPGPQAPSDAAVPDASDWEDSLWEKPTPRTSAPLQVPPGAPPWQNPAVSTPAWQMPAPDGPHWQAAGPQAADPPAPAEAPGSPAAGDEPSASPSGAAPPAVSPEADPPGQSPAGSGPPAPAGES